jgi:hypothetical protein
MRRFMLAGGVACAILLTHTAGAQNRTAEPNAMPGQVVGSYRGQVHPVGQQQPAAAPQLGQNITANALQRPYDPARPFDSFKGTTLDPRSVVAPLVGPDGKPLAPPDTLDQISARIKAFFIRLDPTPPRPNYTPGITRRSQERTQRMWRRD